MTEEARNQEIKYIGLKRNPKSILEFNHIDYIVSKLKDTTTNYDFDLKKLLVENLYENIKYISKIDQNQHLFKRLG